jgi:ERCC4-type nuclease
MRLIVDNREPKDMILELQNRVAKVSLENLELGDFIIKNKKDETILIFERKSLADLISSIKDGRYNEQSFRLSQCELDNKNIYYIIEGNVLNFCNKENETAKKMLFSSMLSLSYKKGFSILHTSGTQETIEFIVRFYEKLASDSEKSEKPITSPSPENTYSNVVKPAKKSNITTDNINEIMLIQIPGISIQVAKSLMVKFKTIRELTNALYEDNKCLDSIIIDYEGGKRKLSKSVIKNLLTFLQVNK